MHYSVQQATAEGKTQEIDLHDTGRGRGITMTLSTVSSNNKFFFSLIRNSDFLITMENFVEGKIVVKIILFTMSICIVTLSIFDTTRE